MEQITIKQSVRQQILFLLLALAMIAASIWMIWIKPEQISGLSLRMFMQVWGKPVGIFGVLFFGASFIYLIYRSLHPRDVLRLNEEGFIDCSSSAGEFAVSWKEIDEIFPFEILTQKFIAVTVNDLENVLTKMTPVKQKIIRANCAMGYPPFLIQFNLARVNLPEMIEIMKKYQQHSYLAEREKTNH